MDENTEPNVRNLAQSIYDLLVETAKSEEFVKSMDPSIFNPNYSDSVYQETVAPKRNTPRPFAEVTPSDFVKKHSHKSTSSYQTEVAAFIETCDKSAVDPKWKKTAAKLKEVLAQTFPSLELEPYGSSEYNLLLEEHSDLDFGFCFEGENTLPSYKATVERFKLLTQRLKQSDYVDVKFLERTRVPVLKCTDFETGVKIDVSCKNANSIKKSRLLRYCVGLSPLVREYLLLLRYWARRRNLILSAFCKMNPYGWTLLALCFVLNFLRESCDLELPFPFTDPDREKFIDTGEGKPPSEKESSDADLDAFAVFVAFCDFVASFDFSAFTASLRSSGFITKEIEKIDERQKVCVLIEDPFDESDNAARNVTEIQLEHIKMECKRIVELSNKGKPFKEIMRIIK